MKIQPITNPDEVTAQLRVLEIFRRQRKEAGFGNTSLGDLLQESQVLIRVLDAQKRMEINMMGEIVRRSIEGE